MRITIAAVGKLKAGPETDLCKRYCDRFDAAGRALGLGPLTIIELPEARDRNVDLRKADEARRLLAKVGDGARIIALDERGRGRTSAEFAKDLSKLRDDGLADVAFIIGGPDGHGPELLDAAHSKLSLGPMTLPHGLARAVLLEQLYRAVTIIAGHPYHRE